MMFRKLQDHAHYPLCASLRHSVPSAQPPIRLCGYQSANRNLFRATSKDTSSRAPKDQDHAGHDHRGREKIDPFAAHHNNGFEKGFSCQTISRNPASTISAIATYRATAQGLSRFGSLIGVSRRGLSCVQCPRWGWRHPPKCGAFHRPTVQPIAPQFMRLLPGAFGRGKRPNAGPRLRASRSGSLNTGSPAGFPRRASSP